MSRVRSCSLTCRCRFGQRFGCLVGKTRQSTACAGISRTVSRRSSRTMILPCVEQDYRLRQPQAKKWIQERLVLMNASADDHALKHSRVTTACLASDTKVGSNGTFESNGCLAAITKTKFCCASWPLFSRLCHSGGRLLIPCVLSEDVLRPYCLKG